MTAGLLAAQGMLLALIARERHGLGQHVDVSLLESALLMQKSSLTRYLQTHKQPPKTGSRAPYATPNQAFRTSDGFIMVAAYTPKRWKSFCNQVLNRPDIEIDPRFSTRQERQLHHQELQKIVSDVFISKTSNEWLALCEDNDILCAPINSYEQVAELPQVIARGALSSIPLLNGHSMGTVSVTPRLSKTPGHIQRPYPEFIGQHTNEILISFGINQEEINRLAEIGAIGIHSGVSQ